MNEALEQVILRRDTWRGRSRHFGGLPLPANSDAHGGGLKSGYRALDDALQQGGWPDATAVEVLSDSSGMGAMGLFLPAMERLSAQGRWQAFIAPPWTPYAPLLAARGIDTQQVLLVHPRSREDLLWSIEQALRSSTCSAVFSWLGNGQYRYSELRKLQLAAADSDSLCVLFRSQQAAAESSPVGLRLQMREYRKVHILKQRGGQQQVDVNLSPSDELPHQPQLWELPVWPATVASSSAMSAG
ncbi:MAG TPA: translesion DNA synthesis-associated protein ImuA [Halieaceae bacterium]|jgi:protein ImuA|uniref:translesion DNA synthesis-associated protein ImuA n=1 Tax=Haliea TaxID=475794 RepID=UPI0004236785|nr:MULTISPECIES: translesion DNA synthesis-associated protein ImuA [Haliea]HAN68010.1 translesion DNA synthesis-associated protein ImuA [Halieaceae bacterium]MAD64686.1 cell division protein FtsZ [Haliea sp.]MAY93182.1 cell division protein FtsZ [Haliea sp.]MBK39615.1 cell division protein FtsZ [Haliea sp.]MBP69592.1 cell division protein FtsZ [Haliea sp.]|tara:strand:- start:1078 stop:1806 length:729 start_codon:yes stop_codon:yes gene_type:complete